jgi:hypothetical protein
MLISIHVNPSAGGNIEPWISEKKVALPKYTLDSFDQRFPDEDAPKQ